MPRPGEKDGVQYYFLTKEDFEAKIAANAFLEHAKYVDNYYGTLEAPEMCIRDRRNARRGGYRGRD